MESLIVLGLLLALNIFALIYGRDSRDGNDWVNHRSV
jgi:hypothetical protein